MTECRVAYRLLVNVFSASLRAGDNVRCTWSIASANSVISGELIWGSMVASLEMKKPHPARCGMGHGLKNEWNAKTIRSIWIIYINFFEKHEDKKKERLALRSMPQGRGTNLNFRGLSRNHSGNGHFR
jgi:hypothetical protein